MIDDELNPRVRAQLLGEDVKRKPRVQRLVERFDRRGTEPFELFRSEFGQNSVRIKEILLEFIRNSESFNINFF